MNEQEIRTKIKSIKGTQKITRAMEMVAASKMKKAQHRMQASKPYYKNIKSVIKHLAEGRLDYKHPYLEKREIQNVGFIVVTSDRGLCGGLNTNLLKMCIAKMAEYKNQNIGLSVCAIGKKAQSFFNRYGGNVIGVSDNIGDKPAVQDLIGIIKIMLDKFDSKEVDKIYLIHNQFINTMTQQANIDILLPITYHGDVTETKYWDYIYEPAPEDLIKKLLLRYIESLVYQGVVENIACEQAARMVAMKNASDNAGDIIDDFQLMYNKARQAAITQELSEIVAGAAAV